MDGYVANLVGPFHGAVGAAFTTFTSRQDVSALPVPVIFPQMLRIGSRVKVEIEGEISSTATPTMVFGLYIGTGVGASGAPAAITTVLAESSAISFATAAAWPFRMEYRGIITTLGTSGQIVGAGDVEYGTSLTAFTSAPIPITQALRTVTINTTVNNAVGVCGTWSASSASNSIKVLNQTVMLMN